MINYFKFQSFGIIKYVLTALNKRSIYLKLICVFFTFSIAFGYASNKYSQTTQLSLKINNQTVQKVLDEIEKQSEFKFFYNNKQINTARVVSVNTNNKDVFTTLEQVFTGTDIAYKVIDKNIILSKKEWIADAGNTTVQATQQQQPTKKISGTVTDESGLPIIGASIAVKGAAIGIATDIEGNFTLNVPEKSMLKISYIGYIPQEVPVTTKSVYDIVLKENQKLLDEVVVTALGIKREEKALGYAVQKVNTKELVSSKGVDLGTSLTGKIAGLNVQNSTEFNSAPILSLRGETPLLVVDGIPYGNVSLNEIPADDIESVDVLKGATASALYGGRGSVGAIMVTTKKGSQNEGINVDVNSNTMFFSGFLALPKVQSAYSRGYGGKYNSDYIWGDKLDIGRTAVQYDPFSYEWKEMPLTSKGKDNFRNFLQFSLVTNNNINVSQKGKYGSFRASMTHVYNRGQYPNQDLNKVTFSTGGTMNYGGFKLDAGLTYNKRISSNDNGSGYSSSYIYDMVIWGATDYDVRDYKDYWVKGKENIQQNWYDNSWYDNPWFKAYEVVDSYDTDITNGYLNASYEITSWLKAMVRGGVDAYSKKNKWQNAMSANYSWDRKGFFGISRNSGYSFNSDAILMADKTWGKFNLDVLGGASMYYYSDDRLRNTTAGGLTVPGFYSLNASVDPIKGSSELYRKQVNSLYSKLSLSWASTYFLDLTGRNDWSSTLSKDDRSYFYPSAAASVVLSEIIPLPSFWNFWKLRSSWTISKQDAAVYGNNNAYTTTTNVWDGLGTATYPNTLIDGRGVKPKKTETIELGTAANFLKNRLFVDFAYYRKVESDFIIRGGISSATGYDNVLVNFKEKRMRNGFEISVGGRPVETSNFQWDILTNWAHDKYAYLDIDPEFSTKKPWVAKGENYYWLDIYDWDRDPQDNIIHNGGIPVKQNFKTKVGNTTPDLVWGITNTLRYKRVTMNFTIDGRVGGLSFSRTHQMLWNSGAHEDSDNHWRYEEVVNGKQTYIGQGVKVVSGSVERDSDGNIITDTRVFAPNDVVVSYEAYISKYHDSASRPSKQNVLDETFFKLRNLSITYDVPPLLCKKIGMKTASVGLTGQNLFLWAKEYKYADPDRGGDSYGYENLNSPSQRYLGINIKANF